MADLLCWLRGTTALATPHPFRLGGNQHPRDDLGIRGQTLILRSDRTGTEEDDFAAVGGTGLFLLNLEYRFPLFGALGGTVFYDAGNVWADWQDMDPADLKGGAGVGVRYLSPIGPLRLDIRRRGRGRG